MSVTPPRPADKLTMGAAYLKRAAPKSWGEMMEAFDVMVGEAAAACVQAPPDQVLRLQGKAQQMLELSTLFTNCLAEADRLEQKLKERQNGR